MAFPFAAVGQAIGTGLSWLSAQQDRAAQLKAAKNSVQWRVEDANKAGINPLAALGMNPISIAPTSVGDPGFAALGQEVERAVYNNSTEKQRGDQLSAKLIDLQVEGAQLDNDIKRAELMSYVRRTAGAPGASGALPENVTVNGDTRTLRHPVFGTVTRQGMAAQDLSNEIGEIADWMEGGNYLNEWFRENTGMPLIGDAELALLRMIGGKGRAESNMRDWLKPYVRERRW